MTTTTGPLAGLLLHLPRRKDESAREAIQRAAQVDEFDDAPDDEDDLMTGRRPYDHARDGL